MCSIDRTADGALWGRANVREPVDPVREARLRAERESYARFWQ